MPAQMTPLDRDRLAKVLALLASPHPGEVHAAAQAAVKFLNAAETTWHELLATKEPLSQELLEAKIHALQEANRRLRSQNHHLRIQARGINHATHNHRLRGFGIWIAFMLLLGLFVVIASM